MNADLVLRKREVIAEIKYLPAVSIVMPFQPVVTPKSKLEYKLKLIMGKIEQELLTLYSVEKAVPLIIKLKNFIRNLNYNTPTKSIVIFVSPVVEKVYYLEIEAEEKISVDEAFKIGDVAYSKKQTIQYLVMKMSDVYSKMFVGNCSNFTLIKSNIFTNAKSQENNFGETFTDGFPDSKCREILLSKFLHQLDQGLSIILRSYPLPVFIMGSKTILDQFKKITTNEKHLAQFIEESYEEVTETDIQNVILPYELNWKKIKQKYLLKQMEKAKEENKLAIGIDQVWSAVMQNKGRLLILETNYTNSRQTLNSNEPFSKIDSYSFYIKDDADKIIEKVFESGGDVEFVEKHNFKENSHLALIKK